MAWCLSRDCAIRRPLRPNRNAISASEMTLRGTPTPTPTFVELASPFCAGLADASGVGLEVVEGPGDDDEPAELQPVSEMEFSERISRI